MHTGTHLLGLTPSELQHWGSSLKGTSGTQGGTEVTGIKAGAGRQFFSQTEWQAKAIVPYLNPPPHGATEPQSQQAGDISETPSTWLTLFDQP